MGITNVADIVAGGQDSSGARIETVYAKAVPMYAVYRTPERVMVQYADDPQLGSDQRQALIASNPLKGEINGLIDGWRKGTTESVLARARLFDRRVADALVVALQGDQAHAVDLLNQIKTDIVAERTSIARTSYLFTSCATTIVLAMIFGRLYADAAAAVPANPFKAGMFQAAAIGALGAFFSIALAIRERKIGTDLQWRDNHADAGLRVVIGVISAAVLYWLMQAKVVSFSFNFGGAADAGAQGDATAKHAWDLVVAFAAGFTERLVGDLLGRAVLGAPAAATNPLAGTAQAGATAATQPRVPGSEKNPLGKPALAAAGGVAAVAALDTVLPDADDRLEGCLDHAALGPDDLTCDIELPEATGGVAGRG